MSGWTPLLLLRFCPLQQSKCNTHHLESEHNSAVILQHLLGNAIFSRQGYLHLLLHIKFLCYIKIPATVTVRELLRRSAKGGSLYK